MNRILFLAWRYVAFNRIKSVILILCLTLTIVLPLTAHLLIAHYQDALMSRAENTPLVVGAKGNRFDLVLKSLYFSSADLDPVYLSEANAISQSDLALPIPLHLRYTARTYPLVGTTYEYFEFRRLRPQSGRLPAIIGECAVGANVASDLGLTPGDHLFSDQRNLYDISKTYPLKMHVVGILEPTGTPDDMAVFVDIKTTWIIDGITHGHRDVAQPDDNTVILKRTENAITTGAGFVEYAEVTPDNIDSFHTHAPPDELPLSAIIALPTDAKAATLIKARYNVSTTHRMLVPLDVVTELMGLVFKIKRFFDANFALISISTGLFLTLVILLSLRLRKREMETMNKLGCSRRTIFWLQTAELAIILAISILVAAGLSTVAVMTVPRFLGIH